jgi:hypothetical protein
MPRLIDNLPWSDADPAMPQWVGTPHGGLVRVPPSQIILWATITEKNLTSLPSGRPLIPILYDTGFNKAFMIRADRLLDWHGWHFIRGLPAGVRLRARGKPIRTLAADMWLYANVPGTRDVSPTATPFRLLLPHGLAVADVGSGMASDLPLLGLLAISYNRCRTTEDGATERFSPDVP